MSAAAIPPQMDRVQGAAYEWWDFAWAVRGTRLAGFTSITVRGNSTNFVLAVYVPQGVAYVGERDLRVGANPLHVRDEALWCDYVCEARLEHWTLQVEAYGLGVASGRELFRHDRGDRLAVGIDIEFVATGAAARDPSAAPAGFVQPGAWSGELLVGRDRWPLRASGVRSHGWGSGWPGDGLATWAAGGLTRVAGGPAGPGLVWGDATSTPEAGDDPFDAPGVSPDDVVPVPGPSPRRRGWLDDGHIAGFCGEPA